MSHFNTNLPIRVRLPILPFPPRQGPITTTALSWNPNLKFLAGDLARLTNLPQHYHFDLSMFQVEWDRSDRSQIVAILPEVTVLTDGNVENVLALAEKRAGGDFLVAVATYWVDRTVYETKWDVQGQAYKVAVESPRHVEEPSNTPVLGVEAGSAEPGPTIIRSFADPRVRAAFESQVNEVVTPQRGTAASVRPSIFSTTATGISTVQQVRESTGIASQAAAQAPRHQAFPGPQHMRDDFHNRAIDAAARESLRESKPLGHLAGGSLHQGFGTEGGRTVLLSEGTGTVGTQRQAGTSLNQGTARQPWGHLNREGRWVME